MIREPVVGWNCVLTSGEVAFRVGEQTVQFRVLLEAPEKTMYVLRPDCFAS